MAGMGRRQRRRERQARQHALPTPATSSTTTPAPTPPAPSPVASQRTAGKRVAPRNLDRLAHLVEDERRLRKAIDVEVDRLTAAGMGWPVIAAVLGVSRQAARQRQQRRHRQHQ